MQEESQGVYDSSLVQQTPTTKRKAKPLVVHSSPRHRNRAKASAKESSVVMGDRKSVRLLASVVAADTDPHDPTTTAGTATGTTPWTRAHQELLWFALHRYPFPDAKNKYFLKAHYDAIVNDPDFIDIGFFSLQSFQNEIRKLKDTGRLK
jgi:hypothetical protein